MKTKLIFFILLIIPVLVNGQQFSNKDKALIATRIDTLLTNYMIKGTLTEPGKIKRSDKVTSEFKKLFALDATIFDDINAEFNQDLTSYPYILMTKTRNEYVDDLIVEFENGLMINNKRVNVSYEEFDKGVIKAAIERTIEGTTKSRKYNFSTHDTVLLSIIVNPDKTVKIKKVEALGNPQVKIKNDDDLDGVIDEIDQCRKQRGLIVLQGCPDSDGDGIADKNDECPGVAGTKENGGCPASTFAYSYVLSGAIGYQLNNNSIKTPELNDLSYSSLDKSVSQKGEVSSPGYKGSLTLSGNIAYYFGKKKNNRNKGISLGFSATNYKAEYDITGSMYQFKSNDTQDDYRRIVTMKKANEKMSFSIINIPLLFRYKEKFSAKSGFELFAGPSFISFITNSNYEATFDFEAIYQIDGAGNFVYNNNFIASTTDLYLTEDEIRNLLFVNVNDVAGPNATVLFEQLSADGYDLALNKSFSGKDNQIQTHYGIAFNGGADLFYHITKKSAIKIGATIIFAPLNSGNSDSYEMINKTNDEYKSIYQSKTNSTYTSFGLNFGFILGI